MISNDLIKQKHTEIEEIRYQILERKNISKTQLLELFNNSNIQYLQDISRKLRRIYKKNEITYSRKIFINLTNLCRDICSYCTYRKEPYDQDVKMMTPEEVIEISNLGKKYRCTEALIVTGEKPEQKYIEAKNWLKKYDYLHAYEYVYDLCQQILDKTGLLPHTNIGNMSFNEIKQLKEVTASMGTMLESSSEELMKKDMAHEFAPSKHPSLRKKTIEDAGKLAVPLTTGLLIGIGETIYDIIDSLLWIKKSNSDYGHIQEIIIQNFSPKINTKMMAVQPPEHEFFLKVLAIARIAIPELNIQAPPNLKPIIYGDYLESGINDWGGISPVTIDYVNPEFPWPKIAEVKQVTLSKGFKLTARLPIYPEYITSNNKQFISSNIQNNIFELANERGVAKEEYQIDY